MLLSAAFVCTLHVAGYACIFMVYMVIVGLSLAGVSTAKKR